MAHRIKNHDRYLLRGANLDAWRAIDQESRKKLLVSRKTIQERIARPPQAESAVGPHKTWTKAELAQAREKEGIDNPFRRIPIRSRVDYENAMLIVDELRRSTASRVASEQLQPFEKMRIDRKLDDAERIFKGKLLSMRLRMLDADYDRQHTIEVRNTDEGLERKSAGTWKRTSEREVMTLAAQDGKEVHVKRGTYQANTEER